MNPTLRAVLYARCSTEEESQKDALANQVKEGINCIQENGWFFVDKYVESKSGTTIKGRDEYRRLYDGLLLDEFDIIVIKSQDRLMRNVKDWYLFLDRMLQGEKRLYLYLEHHFYSADDSLITGIKAILAEDYSRELSKKINNAHHNRQKSGSNLSITSKTYGYDKVEKKVVINEEEAIIVRKMFELCAQGHGSRRIAQILYNEGFANRQGDPFKETVIRRIIRNPLHKGTAVMNKSHYDFTTKQTISMPKAEWIYHEGAVRPIVSEALWDEANKLMDSRATVYQKGTIGKHKGSYDLSGKIRCGICGQPYYHTSRRVGKDRHQVYEWKCSAYLYYGKSTNTVQAGTIRKAGCANISMKETHLIQVIYEAWGKEYEKNYQNLIDQTGKLLRQAMLKTDNKDAISKLEKTTVQIEKQKAILLDKLLKGVIPDAVYMNKNQELEQKLKKAEGQIVDLKSKIHGILEVEERIKKIENRMQTGEFLKKVSSADMIHGISYIEVFPDRLCIHGIQEEPLGEMRKVWLHCNYRLYKPPN